MDDVEAIEKSKSVQGDHQRGYRELFRHPQIWERQAAIACRGRAVCFIPAYSIPAGAHKRTKNRLLSQVLQPILSYRGVSSAPGQVARKLPPSSSSLQLNMIVIV